MEQPDRGGDPSFNMILNPYKINHPACLNSAQSWGCSVQRQKHAALYRWPVDLGALSIFSLYNCCFADAMKFLQDPEVESPSSPRDAAVMKFVTSWSGSKCDNTAVRAVPSDTIAPGLHGQATRTTKTPTSHIQDRQPKVSLRLRSTCFCYRTSVMALRKISFPLHENKKREGVQMLPTAPPLTKREGRTKATRECKGGAMAAVTSTAVTQPPVRCHITAGGCMASVSEHTGVKNMPKTPKVH